MYPGGGSQRDEDDAHQAQAASERLHACEALAFQKKAVSVAGDDGRQEGEHRRFGEGQGTAAEVDAKHGQEPRRAADDEEAANFGGAEREVLDRTRREPKD
ncbi:hypothetical protein MMC16_005941 [Acarospora aff. strigata]|nr:hypothetical protein [Acarospora aff. strigata]